MGVVSPVELTRVQLLRYGDIEFVVAVSALHCILPEVGAGLHPYDQLSCSSSVRRAIACWSLACTLEVPESTVTYSCSLLDMVAMVRPVALTSA